MINDNRGGRRKTLFEYLFRNNWNVFRNAFLKKKNQKISQNCILIMRTAELVQQIFLWSCNHESYHPSSLYICCVPTVKRTFKRIPSRIRFDPPSHVDMNKSPRFAATCIFAICNVDAGALAGFQDISAVEASSAYFSQFENGRAKNKPFAHAGQWIANTTGAQLNDDDSLLAIEEGEKYYSYPFVPISHRSL